MGHQLRDAGAELLVTVPALLPAAQAGAAGTGVREIAVIGAAEGALPLEAMMGERMTAQVPVDPARSVVVMPYSSGTTGLPKGVMLTHRNLVANVLQTAAVVGIRPGDVTLAFLPYFHIYGMTVLMNLYLAAGGVQVTLPRFELEAALRLIAAHRMRQLFVAPPVVLALAQASAGRAVRPVRRSSSCCRGRRRSGRSWPGPARRASGARRCRATG